MKIFTSVLCLVLSCMCAYAQTIASTTTTTASAPKTRYAVSKELQTLKEDTNFDVRVSTYTFRKIDKNHRVAEFTLLDAVKLEGFFMKQKGFMSCETHALDKTAKVTTDPGFDHKIIIADIEKMGYIVTNLRSSLLNVVFAAKGSCNDKALNANIGDADCHDCGKQQVKKDLLDKFKDADYGGAPMINFDLGGVGATPIDTSVASDQND